MDMLFLRPSTQEEALALLTQYKQDAMIVAGGTDAVLRLTQKKTAPAVILSLDAIPERHEISASDDTVRLASGVTYNELLASDVLRLYRGCARRCCIWRAPPSARWRRRWGISARPLLRRIVQLCSSRSARAPFLRQTAARGAFRWMRFSFRPTRPYVRATSLSRPLRSRRSGRERGQATAGFPGARRRISAKFSSVAACGSTGNVLRKSP